MGGASSTTSPMVTWSAISSWEPAGHRLGGRGSRREHPVQCCSALLTLSGFREQRQARSSRIARGSRPVGRASGPTTIPFVRRGGEERRGTSPCRPRPADRAAMCWAFHRPGAPGSGRAAVGGAICVDPRGGASCAGVSESGPAGRAISRTGVHPGRRAARGGVRDLAAVHRAGKLPPLSRGAATPNRSGGSGCAPRGGRRSGQPGVERTGVSSVQLDSRTVRGRDPADATAGGEAGHE